MKRFIGLWIAVMCCLACSDAVPSSHANGTNEPSASRCLATGGWQGDCGANPAMGGAMLVNGSEAGVGGAGGVSTNVPTSAGGRRADANSDGGPLGVGGTRAGGSAGSSRGGAGSGAGNASPPAGSAGAVPFMDEWRVYFGDPHNHSAISCREEDGDDCADFAGSFESAKKSGAGDWVACTDHSEYFNTTSVWTEMVEASRANTEDGVFVSIPGYEYAVSDPTEYDDMQTFGVGYTGRWLDAEYSMSYLEFLDRLVEAGAEGVTSFTHPGRTGDVDGFNGFAGYDAKYDRTLTLLEIQNGDDVYEAYFQTALDKGWHVAPTLGGDNHNNRWLRESSQRTAIVAKTLTSNSLLDAMKNRRVYATQVGDLRMIYTLNGSIMGSGIAAAARYDIEVRLESPSSAVSLIEVIGNQGALVAKHTANSTSLTYTDSLTLPPTISYLYVKVTTKDDGMAWSAPIWLGWAALSM